MPLQREDVRVAEIVRNVVELYEPVAEEKQTTITIEVPEDLEVVADRIRLRQVLANLVDNAIKYSRGGQRVTISARRVNDHVQIAVVDQGIGIPPGDIDKIWNRLFRGDASRTERGLGLGLSFVKAIVEAHGGTVRVESEVDKGARFIVDIPGRPPATA